VVFCPGFPYNNARLVTEMDNELTRYHKITFNSDIFIIDSHETTIYIANTHIYFAKRQQKKTIKAKKCNSNSKLLNNKLQPHTL